MARCELTLTTKVRGMRLAWAVAYALAPAVYLGIISERWVTRLAMRFVRVTVTTN